MSNKPLEQFSRRDNLPLALQKCSVDHGDQQARKALIVAYGDDSGIADDLARCCSIHTHRRWQVGLPDIGSIHSCHH
jgi:hypothetical protein